MEQFSVLLDATKAFDRIKKIAGYFAVLSIGSYQLLLQYQCTLIMLLGLFGMELSHVGLA